MLPARTMRCTRGRGSSTIFLGASSVAPLGILRASFSSTPNADAHVDIFSLNVLKIGSRPQDPEVTDQVEVIGRDARGSVDSLID